MPSELDRFHPAILAEFHSQMNFITAGGIITMDTDAGVGQLPEIPRFSRMIENHFLVKFFQFRTHETFSTTPSSQRSTRSRSERRQRRIPAREDGSLGLDISLHLVRSREETRRVAQNIDHAID